MPLSLVPPIPRGPVTLVTHPDRLAVADYWPRHGKIEFCKATIGYSAEPAVQLPPETEAAPAAAAMSAAVAAASEMAAEVAETAPLTPAATPVLRNIDLTIEAGQKVSAWW